jgi:hypothetical protein
VASSACPNIRRSGPKRRRSGTSCPGRSKPRGPGFPTWFDAEGLSWDGERVITRDEAPGLVGTLADTRIAPLTIVRSAELEEIPLFLTLLHRARALTPEDEDNLLTLLWQQDFDRIHYKLAVGGTEPDGDAEEGENGSMFLDLALLDLAPAEILRELW